MNFIRGNGFNGGDEVGVAVYDVRRAQGLEEVSVLQGGGGDDRTESGQLGELDSYVR